MGFGGILARGAEQGFKTYGDIVKKERETAAAQSLMERQEEIRAKREENLARLKNDFTQQNQEKGWERDDEVRSETRGYEKEDLLDSREYTESRDLSRYVLNGKQLTKAEYAELTPEELTQIKPLDEYKTGLLSQEQEYSLERIREQNKGRLTKGSNKTEAQNKRDEDNALKSIQAIVSAKGEFFDPDSGRVELKIDVAGNLINPEIVAQIKNKFELIPGPKDKKNGVQSFFVGQYLGATESSGLLSSGKKEDEKQKENSFDRMLKLVQEQGKGTNQVNQDKLSLNPSTDGSGGEQTEEEFADYYRWLEREKRWKENAKIPQKPSPNYISVPGIE